MFNRKLKEDVVMLRSELRSYNTKLSARVSSLESDLSVVQQAETPTEVQPVADARAVGVWGRWVSLLHTLNSAQGAESVAVFSSKAEAKLAQVGVVCAAQRYGQTYMSRRKARTVTFTRIA
jgi:hypothetical protein